MYRKIFLFALIVTVGRLSCTYSQDIKQCEFAGYFYPKEKNALNSTIDSFLRNIETSPISGKILGVISPHAGYVYSGQIAAYSYKILENKSFDAVFILGQSHRYDFDGISIYLEGSFATPLGNIDIDSETSKEFNSLEFVSYDTKYFNGEHSLEVQLPFIIKALGKVKIVPVIFGRVNNEQLQEFVEKIVQISETKNILVIVSTDLSHYNTYKKAVDVDSDTIGLIRNKDINSLRLMQEKGEGRACGISPLVVFLLYSQAKDAKINILKYANSGDTSGDKDRVVGYVSAVAYTPDKDYKSKSAGLSQEGKKSEKGEEMNEFNLSKEERVVLLNIARFTLENFLKDKKVPKFKVESQKLKEKRGVFVTLKKKGHLRGCIGVIVADTALYEAVSKLAIDSALNDPRFPALEHGELKEVEIEISVLTPFSEVKNLGEIEVGKHGLMIKKGFYSGLLLPQVPLEYNWDKETFLEHLCLKAGLPTSSYKDKDAILYKFSAIVFNESELAH